MSLFALDSISAVDPRLALAKNRRAIGRYLVGPYALTRAELESYTEADFYVFALYEDTTADVRGGENLGVAHAHQALQAINALGLPKGTVVTPFFACDTDPAGLNGGPLSAVPYYRGTSIVRSSGCRNGAYLGAAAANDCLKAAVVDRVMTPNASSWADGATPEREDILQGLPEITIGTSQYDPDVVYTTDVLFNLKGNYQEVPPIPPGECAVDMPILKAGDTGQAVEALQGALAGIKRWTAGASFDGNFGPDTIAGVKGCQHAHGLPETGQTDAKTWAAIFGLKSQ